MSASIESNKDAKRAPAQDSPKVPPPTITLSDDLDYEDLAAAYDSSFKNLSEGEVISGKVIKVTASHVLVDVGFKSEGAVPLSEFREGAGVISVKPGDSVDVLLENSETLDGGVVLSREKAERMKIWDTIEDAYRDQKIIPGLVIERVKGGLAVDIGVRAFLPGSQVDMHPVRNLDSLRGQELQLRVIKVNKRRGNIVLSRKAVLEAEYHKRKEETLKSLKEGDETEGLVKNITDYGAFVDLGGIDGLLHITDMSWGRVNHPSDLFKVGDSLQVKVLKFDRVDEKVSLGYKQLSADPWLTVAQRYPRGSRVPSEVVSLTDYGAFVELEEGVEGLIHISEMTWNRRIKHPSKLLAIGDEVQAVVLDVDADARRISMGMKQTEPNPWDSVEERYAINSQVTGSVRNLTDFGAFVEVEEGIEGLVHISDLSWTKRVKHPSEVLQKGDDVTAVVLSVDAESQRLSLGIKQLQPDEWEDFFSQHQVGDLVRGKVVRQTSFGAFVELADGVEGLCHVSELDDERVEDPESHFDPGQEVDFRIINLNLLERKVGLSVKAVAEEAGRESWSYRPETATTSIGELAGKELGELGKSGAPAEDAVEPPAGAASTPSTATLEEVEDDKG